MAEKKAVAKTTDKKAAAKKSDSGKKRFNLVKTFKDMWAELKKVTWPTKSALINYTLVVLAFIVAMGIVIFVIDSGAAALVQLITK